MYREGILDHTEVGFSILANANASGIAQGYLGPCPQGYCWYVERYTNWSNTAATSGVLVELFSVTSQQLNGYTATAGSRAGRQDVTAIVNNGGDNASPIVVPAGYFLVALWTGLTSGDLTELSTQVAVHQLIPTRISSPQDMAAAELEHDRAREHVALSHRVTGDVVV